MFTSQEPQWTPAERQTLAADGPEASARNRPKSVLFDPVLIALFVWRAKFWILAAGILGAAAAAALALATPKEYTATTQLIFDPRALNLVQNDVTPNGLPSSEAALALIQSQIAVITSNSVLSRVVDAANLTQDPEFNGTAPSLLEQYLPSGVLLMLTDPGEATADRRLLTLANFRRSVDASRSANSFVIDLSVTSRDPQKAADLANLTTDIFVEEQARAQSVIARRATAELSARLVDLRNRVGEAESAVERYKAENQLVGVGGRLIDDEYILRINNQLADVRAEIAALDVRAQSMRETSVDEVVAGTFPEELSSEALVRLRQTFAELSQTQAGLAAQLGPRHPQRIASEEALAASRRAIAAELARIIASAQTELARARATERELTAQIDRLRSEQIETSGAFVELRELERDVDASRAVYENYLLRARELAQQESLNTVNVRTISEATVPLHPSSMSRKTVVLAGLLAGLALGFALALLVVIIRSIRRAFAEAESAPQPAAPSATGLAAPMMALPAPRLQAPHAVREDDGSPAERDVGSSDGASQADDTPERHWETVEHEPRADAAAKDRAEAAEDVRTETGDASDRVAEESAEAPDPDEGVAGDPAERRARLRRRIREIALRRPQSAPPLDADPESFAAGTVSGKPKRPTIAEIRRRRLMDRIRTD